MYSFCSNTTFTPNSKYQTNLNTVFHSLSSNATTPTGFSTAAAGTGTTKAAVYGLFLCRGDQNATACSDCVATATTQNYCPNSKEAVIWYDECMVRYSNKSISGKVDTIPGILFRNGQNSSGSQTEFPGILEKTVNDVMVTAANEDNSGKKFATAQAYLTSSKTLYVLEQCTPDLTVSDCNQCLTEAIKELPLSDGGRVLMPSCNLRYELYRFFSLSTMPPAPGPAPATKFPGKDPQTSPTAAAIESNYSTTTIPGMSASGKMTLSHYVNIVAGFGIFATVNLYYYFI